VECTDFAKLFISFLPHHLEIRRDSKIFILQQRRSTVYITQDCEFIYFSIFCSQALIFIVALLDRVRLTAPQVALCPDLYLESRSQCEPGSFPTQQLVKHHELRTFCMVSVSLHPRLPQKTFTGAPSTCIFRSICHYLYPKRLPSWRGALTGAPQLQYLRVYVRLS
jgi:hypothetical protein